MGVFLASASAKPDTDSLPHARGGVSPGLSVSFVTLTSSPRPWGCFSRHFGHRDREGVFPTPVGVFLLYSGFSWFFSRSSPRPWGCFPRHWIPAPALDCLPHARGGVSPFVVRLAIVVMSSPRPWGCFLRSAASSRWHRVFPTPVGVFLRKIFAKNVAGSLPHARGGVSLAQACRRAAPVSSPRPWGCFSCDGMLLPSFFVFPTPVGVFLKPDTWYKAQDGLPHARGGVSRAPVESSAALAVFPTPVGVFRWREGLI